MRQSSPTCAWSSACWSTPGKNQAARRIDVAAEERALQNVNARLWDIEDRIRDKEAVQTFDRDFIELARAVYVSNDERAAIKKRINQKLGSRIVEEKSYRPYSPGTPPEALHAKTTAPVPRRRRLFQGLTVSFAVAHPRARSGLHQEDVARVRPRCR